jgi:hypothetical protein
VRSVNSGLRLTGAGLAAALAVLLVLDVGGVVGGGDEDTRGGNTSFFSATMRDTANDSALEGAESQLENPTTEAGSDDAYLTPAGSPLDGAGTGSAGAVGSEPAPSGGEPTSTPFSAGVSGPPVEESPADSAPPNPTADDDAVPSPEMALRSSAIVTPTPTEAPADVAGELGLNGYDEQDTGTLTTSDANADSDDGPSALLVTEIVLAALLGASIVGVAAATYAERRRR